MSARRLGACVVTWMLLVAALLSNVGCGPHPAPTPATLPKALHLPHRGPLFVNLCLEASTLYDPRLTADAAAWMAIGLEGAVRQNTDALTFALTFIDTTPLAPESSPPGLTVTLPAIDGYPAEPALEPMPATTGKPWQDAQNQREAQARNNAKIKAYSTAIQRVDAQVAAAKSLAEKTAQQLRTLQPPPDQVGDKSSVWGCVDVAARRFGQFSGAKVLALATSADEQTWADRVPSDLAGLKGAHVIAIFYQCAQADFCAYKQSTWEAVFNAAGAAPDERWMDPGQTRATNPSVVFDLAVSQ